MSSFTYRGSGRVSIIGTEHETGKHSSNLNIVES